MSLQNLLAQETREDDGAWLPLPEELGGEMLISYFGNPDFRKKLQRLETIYRKQHSLREDKGIPDDAMEKLVLRAMVGTVAKAIRDVKETEDAAEPMPDTEESIERLLEVRTVRARVVEYAKDRETFRSENLELIAKT